MTLDEAIEHAKEVARTCDDSQCAAEHMQLAEWLKKARIYEKVKKMSVSMIRKLDAENAKLRELVHKQDALTKAVHAYWAGGEESLDDFNVMMNLNAQVLKLMCELGIEVDDGETDHM